MLKANEEDKDKPFFGEELTNKRIKEVIRVFDKKEGGRDAANTKNFVESKQVKPSTKAMLKYWILRMRFLRKMRT
jgi:hypothetical protein